MANVDRRQGFSGPRDPAEARRKDSPMDPEKFKKVLKIEETDESQKRNKRRMGSKEDIEEDDIQPDATTDTPPESTVNFSEYMQQEQAGENPFGSESKVAMKRAEKGDYNIVPEAEGPRMFAGGVGAVDDGGISVEESNRFMAGLPQAAPSASPAETSEQAPYPPDFPQSQPSEEPPETKQSVQEPQTSPSYQGQRSEKQSKEGPPQSTPTQEKKKDLKAPGKPISPEKKLKIEKKKALAAKGKEGPAVEKPVEQMKSEEKDAFVAKFRPKGKEEKISEEKKQMEALGKMSAGAPAEEIAGAQQREAALVSDEFDTDKKKKDETAAGFELDGAGNVNPASIETPLQNVNASLPAYANLSPQMFELFEKMVGYITIQKEGGKTQTTVTLNMKGSVFNGSQIILDHYSTAPNSFNVTLAGSPEAMSYFNENMEDLIAAMQQTKSSFDVNIQRPILLADYQGTTKKKEIKQKEEKKKINKERVEGVE